MSNNVWISELTLQGFGLYSEGVTFSFDSGINLVIGGNETGKSTLAAGICAVLFGMPANVDPTAYGSSRYRSWHNPEPFRGRIALVTDDLSYEVDRDFVTHRIKVRELPGGAPREIIRGVHNPRASRPNTGYLTFLRKVTGVETAELFRQIYLVEQPLPGQNGLSKDLQQLLSGGGHYESVRELLRVRLKDITRNPERYDVQMNPGRKDQQLEVCQCELDDVARSVAQSRESLGELMSIAAELEPLRVTLNDAQRQLNILRAQREALVELAQLQKQVDKAAEQRGRLGKASQQIAELQTLLQGAESQLAVTSDLSYELSRLGTLATALSGRPDAVPGEESYTVATGRELSLLRSRLEQAEFAEMRIAALGAQLEPALGRLDQQPENCHALLEELAGIHSLSQAHRPGSRPLLAGAAFAFLIYLLAGSRLSGPPYLVPAICLLAGAIVSMTQFTLRRGYYRKQMRRITAQFKRPLDPSQWQLADLAEAVREYRRLESEFSVACSSAVSQTLQEAEERLDQWMALSEAYRTARERQRRLMSQAEGHRFALAEVVRAHGLDDLQELESRLQLADDDYYYARRAVEQHIRERGDLPTGAVIDVRETDALIAATHLAERDLTAETVALDGQIRDLLFRQSRLEGTNPPNIAQAEERQYELMNKCHYLQSRAQASGLALRELGAAVRQFQDQYRLQVSELIEARYRAMTGNRRTVFCDDEFRLRLREPDGMELDPSQLSQGSRDQLYIALRLALAEFMSARSSFPLIFDDPFLTSDNERLENIRSSLHAAGRQVILLSHNPIFSPWGSAVSVRAE